MLSHRQYLDAPEDCVKAGLVGPVDSQDARVSNLLGLTIFHRHQANDPDDEKARWLMESLSDLLNESVFWSERSRQPPVLSNIFRRDIYLRGQAALIDQFRKIEAEAQTFQARVGNRP